MQPEVRLQGNLMIKGDGRVQVIPVTLRKRFFEITHNTAHLGSRRTYQQLSSSYCWYGMRDQSIYSWSWTLSQSVWKPIHFQTKRPRRALQLSTMACSPDSDCLVNCIQVKVEILRVNWSQSSAISQESTRPGLQRSIHALMA